MRLNVFLPILYSLLGSVAIVWFLNQPTIIWYLPIFFILASVFVSWSFCRQAKNFFGWWQFGLLPIIANITSLVYLVIVTDKILVYLILILLAIFNYIYWRYLFFYLNNARRYQPFSLEFLSFYLSFVLVFLAGASLYGLKSFLDLGAWTMTGIAGLFLLAVIYQFSWISKYNYKEVFVYLLAIWLILVELFAVLQYLPLNYNVLGLIFSTAYYLLIVIINDKLKDKLNSQRLRIYLGVSLLVVLSLLLSARWI